MVFKDDQLIFRCFECKNNYKKDLIERFATIYMNFVMETLINLFCYQEKVFILMNTWIVGKDLMKHHYLIKKLFVVV